MVTQALQHNNTLTSHLQILGRLSIRCLTPTDPGTWVLAHHHHLSPCQKVWSITDCHANQVTYEGEGRAQSILKTYVYGTAIPTNTYIVCGWWLKPCIPAAIMPFQIVKSMYRTVPDPSAGGMVG